jgi:hypothetical protein
VNRLYVFDKKKKKVISDYFGFITNAICLWLSYVLKQRDATN